MTVNGQKSVKKSQAQRIIKPPITHLDPSIEAINIMSDLDADFLCLPNATNEDDSDSDDSKTSTSSNDGFDPNHLPPWLLNTLPSADEHPLVRLHNEIVQFSKVSFS
jgi:hypothetical protein